jgi:hypothetical protein
MTTPVNQASDQADPASDQARKVTKTIIFIGFLAKNLKFDPSDPLGH